MNPFRKLRNARRLRYTAVAGLGLLALSVSGCSRTFWRAQADADVYEAIGDQLVDPRWAVPRLDITPDPRSRFFDPFDPDHSPLPPDDPAAHRLMHCVDGKQGYAGWHKFGDHLNVENPAWLAQFGITPDMIDPATGAYIGKLPALERVTLPQAVELSLIHSRDYQTQLEAVYLSALDVTFERFQFGVRYLGIGGGEPSANSTYTLRPEGRADQLALGGRFGVSQLLPAGGQIAMELANNTLWLFGPDSTSSASTLSYSLVQPLLFGAGRKVVMENLTQTERNLLYSLRDLARFRRTFFTDVVGANGGYLGLLSTVQTIRNQEDNITRIEKQVAELQANNFRPGIPRHAPLDEFPDVEVPESLQQQLRYNPLDFDLSWLGAMSDEQEQALRGLSSEPAYRRAANELIEQVRAVTASLDELQLQSQLASARNALRDSRRLLQDALDSYKLRLGLPTDMPIGIDDRLLTQFQLIDPDLRRLEDEVDAFVIEFGAINDEDPDQGMLTAALVRYLPLAEEVQKRGVGLLEQDLKRVEGNLTRRLAQLPDDAERDRVRADITGDVRNLQNLRAELLDNIAQAREDQAIVDSMPDLDLDQRKQFYTELDILQEKLLEVVRGMTVTQIGLRLELITVQDFEMELEQAVAIALENRVDLMNQRAQVVDAYRRVEVTANRLMSRIDLVAQGDIRNTGAKNPVDFRLDRSDFRFGVQFTAPLDQINERNAYRAAQIAYQRERRAYIDAEDGVKQDVRQAWRQLDVLKGNLETSKQSVRIAARRLDSAIQEANDPSRAEGSSGGLRGQQLLSALTTVLDAQNRLLADWVRYEQNRLNIHRDMGIMEVGPDGLWIDPFYQSSPDETAPTPSYPSFEPGSPPPSAAAGWQGAYAPDARGSGGGGDRRDRDGVVLVGYGAGMGGTGEQPGLVSFAAGDGDPRSVPRERLRSGARRQPEERDADQ
ncbi:MAG: TolC family protein [Planctomycetaceae bacterium]|nr:TolC family protein [Planctomycetaceae bacterium]